MSFSVLEKYSTVPLEINLISGRRHCLEIGCGLTFSKRIKGKNNVIISERIETIVIRSGYRYRADNGFLFRIAPLLLVNPSISYSGSNIIFCFGISLGGSF
jgi:hypothetical protein